MSYFGFYIANVVTNGKLVVFLLLFMESLALFLVKLNLKS